ncbi:MAG: SDR family NAD(P)-dependent oxidoreductase [Gemmataceae bacterium]|nr:SDR family NAD(P)-dependent oxidoreductase [Gemmataceae bacterium]MCI0738407.1 SDR family NAD(P)-dependent oxidoreductase [Gemmataceae bacterium]
MSFANQVAVITGASSGIGWEVAKVLAAQGCAVGLLARRMDRLEELASDIRAAGGQAATVQADVTQRQETVAAIHRLRDALGPVDLLLANSGIGKPTEIEPMNMGDVDYMIRVNFLGVVYAIEGVLPEMLERKKGHLAAISSLGAYKGLPGESGYCASKAAVHVYMEGLRIQLRTRGIAVTSICPGFIKTPMTDVNTFPMPFLMTADKAAQKIVRALAKRKKVYNFPWRTTVLMKSLRWLPDWLVARIISGYTEHRPPPAG